MANEDVKRRSNRSWGSEKEANAKSETQQPKKKKTENGKKVRYVRGVSWLLWNAVRRQVIVFDFIFLAFSQAPLQTTPLYEPGCQFIRMCVLGGLFPYREMPGSGQWPGLTPELVSSPNRGIWGPGAWDVRICPARLFYES